MKNLKFPQYESFAPASVEKVAFIECTVSGNRRLDKAGFATTNTEADVFSAFLVAGRCKIISAPKVQ